MKQIYLMLSFLFLVGCNVQLGEKPSPGGNNNNNGNPPSSNERLAIAPNSIYVQTIVNRPVSLSVLIQNKTSQVISGIVSSLGNNFSEIDLINDECLTAILAPQASCRLDFEMNSSVPITRTTTLTVTSASFTSVADFVFKALPEPSNNSILATNAFQLVNQGSVLSDDLSSYVASGVATSFTALSQPSNGSLSLNNSTGELSYTPNLNFSGLDSFTFKANGSSGSSNVATYQIFVQDMASQPTAFNMSVAVNKNSPKQLILNAQDDDNRPLSYSIVSQPVHGTLSGSGPNRTYTPYSNYLGSDSFTFRVNNGSFNSNVATVTLTVASNNQAPLAMNSNVNVGYNAPATFSLPATDADSDPLSYTVVTQPMHGTLSGSGSSRTYTPNLNYSGSDSLSFKANDGSVDSNTAVIFFNVSTPGGNGGGPNQAPISQGQSVATQEDVALPLVLTASDLNNDTLTYSIVTQPLHGTISGTGQNITYTPAANYFGSDSFTFKANDGALDSNISTISVSISSINDAPVASNLSKVTQKNVATSGSLIASDVENNPLTYSVVTQPLNGSVVVSGSSFTYTPNNNYSGSDSFTYRANDGSLFSNAATVSITVQNTNTAPVASNANYSLQNTSTVNIQLIASDADSNTLTYTILTQPQNGTLSGSGSNYVFTPSPSYVGSDSFTFRVNDGTVNSNVATVSINILASTLNQAPVASNQSEIIIEDTPKTFNLSASDANNDPLTVIMSQAPLHGTVTFTGIVATYTPNLNYTGVDSFVYQVSDGSLTSMMATVSLTISPVNDGPTLAASSYSTNEDIPILNFTVPAVDPENDVLTYTIVSTTSNGVLTYNNATKKFSYTPSLNYVGSDSFTVTVSDGQLTSAPKTYPITVFPLNDAPIANAQNVATQEDTAKSITLTGSDPENSSLTYVITSQPSNGTLSGSGPNLIYNPTLNFNGSDSFKFKVNDGNLDSAEVTVSISVSPVNDAPIALGQSYSTQLNTAISVTLIGQDVENSPLTYSLLSQPSNGTLSGTAPNLTYTPNSLYSGSDSFTFKVNDGSLDSNAATISVQVNNSNLPPVASPQNVAVVEDTPKPITLVGTDPNGDPLSYIIVSQPANGTITGSGANIVYTPASNFNGVDSFVFRVNDGTVNSNTATVSLVVSSVNDAPVALNQSQTLAEDTTKNLVLFGTDVEGSVLGYTILTQPANGTLIGSGNSYVYTPASNYSGSDSFTFKVNDGSLDSNVATVSLTITASNDAPVAANQSQSLAEDTAKNLTLSASDADGNSLTYSIVTQPSNGTLVGSGNSYVYTPALNYNGADSFTFKANDGTIDSNIATVSLTVTPVNDAPVALNQSQSLAEDTPKNLILLGTDVDGNTLTYSIVSQPLNGTLTGSGSSYTYSPNLNYVGTDSFTFKVNDGSLNSNIATVSLTVTNSNQSPVASNQSQTLAEDTAKNLILMATDQDANTLTYSIVLQPANGTLTGSGNNYTYTPNANYTGADSFTFKANDGMSDSNIATVSLTVTPVNDAPVALAQTVAVVEDTAKSIILQATDVENSPLTYTIVTQPMNGTITGSGTSYVYTPSSNYTGADSFTFKANDGSLDSNVATVSINVSGVNDAPVALAQAQTLAEDTSKNIILAATDADGNTLGYTIVSSPLKGTLSGSGNMYTYTPNANYNGADSFTFKANDGSLDSNIATVSLTVTPVNDAPVANPLSFSTNEDVAYNGSLVATDVDGNTLTYSIVGSPTKGTVTIINLQTGAFVYTPNANYNGADSFSFMVNDGTLNSNIAMVSVTVSSVNDAPIAQSQSLSTTEDVAKSIVLTATDLDNDSLTYSIVTQPANGTISGSLPNVTYTPAANYNGSDSFTFRVNDGTVNSNIATVSLTISAVNDAPVAQNLSSTTTEDVPVNIVLLATDVENSPLTYTIVTQPANGTISGTAPNLTFTPAANYAGSSSFTYKVNDGSLDSNIATVSLTISAVNDAPVANNLSISTNKNTLASSQVIATDVEGSALTYSVVVGALHGTVSLNSSTGAFTYSPTTGYVGSDLFTYRVNDGSLNSNIATVSISVLQTNQAPVAQNSSINAYLDQTTVTGQAIATDADGDTLTYSLVGSNPNVSMNANGSFTYTNSPAVSTATITFKANDGLLNSNTATVTINFVLRDNSLKLETNPSLVSHSLNNYPLLLDLQAFAHQEHFWSNVQSNGGDIVMTLADKVTKIPLDVRNFNKTARTGQLWFKSNVIANTKNGFYLHYNNNGAPIISQPAKTSTFGAYNVWNNSAIAYWDMHMNGAVVNDATINQHNLTVYFNPLSNLNSYIDQGVLFNSDGLKDDVVKALSTPVSKLNFEVTISAWVYPTKSVYDSIILKKEGTSDKNNYYLGLDKLKPAFTFDNNCGKKTISSEVAVPLNEWSLVTGTFNQTTMRSRIYINGVLVKEGDQSDHFPDHHDSLSDAKIQIGGEYGANSKEFVGTIDELNLHASAWSQEFIKNYYNMTNQPNTYWLIDSEEVVFSDSFNRLNSNTISNGWTELEGCSMNANSSLNLLGLLGTNISTSASGCGYIKNYSDQANFYDLTDSQGYPELNRTLTAINSGNVFLSFYVDFLRESTESEYSVVMNIGEASKNIASLVWGSPSFGLTSHTGIGFVNNINTITQLKQLNHRELLVFNVNFSNKTIGIYLKGAKVSSVPFDDSSSVLSKISFIVNKVSSCRVPRIYFDNVVIKKK